MKIIDLTKESFVEKVADYQSYPDNWEYKGNKPCLVDFHAPWGQGIAGGTQHGGIGAHSHDKGQGS